MKRNIILAAAFALCVGLLALSAPLARSAFAGRPAAKPTPKFSTAVAFDVSPRLSDAKQASPATRNVKRMFRQLQRRTPPGAERRLNQSDKAVPADRGFSGDGAVQESLNRENSSAIPAPLVTFEGISNQDNFNIFGFRVNPPDPVGDVGPNNYVEMVNLAFAVYDKQGNLQLGPMDIGALWAGFAIEDCTDPSGDPIVIYDQLADRWLLTQFTVRSPYYDCVAISQSGDPTGAYYRYAFITQADPNGGYYFPDYPKYSVWTDSYVLTTRDFGDSGGYGISVYGLEKNKMVNGQADARAVQFFLDSNVVPLNLIGDGLLPADIDGKQKPKSDAKIPIFGTQDDDYVYGATFDAINIWDFQVKWRSTPTASLELAAQLPVTAFDSNFPCAPTSRDCLPQPGITNPAQYLDILSYRQRPTYRLAYRNFKAYETLVTSQSVEALPGVAGMRWYEVRRTGGTYALYQQGTYAPGDGVHRWMGSVAMDKKGNMALGYSVVNATTVFPGIRYTGRLSGDPLGQMTLGEGVVINGSGVQTTTNSRWGDYTSMNIDPNNDCTFWYVNEYYTAAGQASSLAGWQTRIGSFKLPGCQ